MKKIIFATVFAIIGVCSAMAQTVQLNSNCRILDGSPVELDWSYQNPPPGTVAEISIIGLVNGQESFGYRLAQGDLNPASGKLVWNPRVLRVTGESYKIRVTWKTAKVNTLVTNKDTPVFKIILSSPRTLTLTKVADTGVAVNDGASSHPLIQIAWQSKNVPANAKIRLVAQPANNTEAGGVTIGESSDTGGFMWYVDSTTIAPGNYVISAFYVTEYGIFGAQSQGVPYTVQ